MPNCTKCGKEKSWFELFPGKEKDEEICKECSDSSKPVQAPINMAPSRKQLRPSDPEFKRLIGRTGK